MRAENSGTASFPPPFFPLRNRRTFINHPFHPLVFLLLLLLLLPYAHTPTHNPCCCDWSEGSYHKTDISILPLSSPTRVLYWIDDLSSQIQTQVTGGDSFSSSSSSSCFSSWMPPPFQPAGGGPLARKSINAPNDP